VTYPKQRFPLNPASLLYLQSLWRVENVLRVRQDHQPSPQATQKTFELLTNVLLSRKSNVPQSPMMINKSKLFHIRIELLLTLNRPPKKESKLDLHEEYLAAARCITRCVDMFCKIDKVIDIGALLKQRELADSGDLSEDEDDAARRKKQLSKLYG